MKKTILMAAAAIMTAMTVTGANAQTKANAQDREKFWVGGNFSVGSTELSTVASMNSFTIMPEFGYKFSDRWAAGIRLGMSQSKIDGASQNTVQAFNVAPFARYTFLNWKALSLFVDGGFSYDSADGRINAEGTYFGNGVDHIGIFVDPGFSVRLSRRFALVGSMNVFSAGYTETLSGNTNVGQEKTSTWSASLNSPFDLGGFMFGFNFTF